MTSEVVVRAFHSNAPISEDEKAEYSIWSDQGWIGCEYKPATTTQEGLGWFDQARA